MAIKGATYCVAVSIRWVTSPMKRKPKAQVVQRSPLRWCWEMPLGVCRGSPAGWRAAGLLQMGLGPLVWDVKDQAPRARKAFPIPPPIPGEVAGVVMVHRI